MRALISAHSRRGRIAGSPKIQKTNGSWIIVRGERRELVSTSAPRPTASAAIDFAIDAIDGEEMK